MEEAEHNQMMKAEYKLSKKRQRRPEERPQCQGRVCVGQQRMSGTMKISRIVEQLESLAEQFRHYYTLGNREPWRLLSERVTNDMPNKWSTEWIERREINNNGHTILRCELGVKRGRRVKTHSEEGQADVIPVTDGALWPSHSPQLHSWGCYKVKWG